MNRPPPSSSNGEEHDKPLLRQILPKLRPFQREALEFATQGKVFARQWTSETSTTAKKPQPPPVNPQGRLLLADEMGCGKTVTALAIAAYYEPEWPLLIICPASLKFTWPAEMEKFFPGLPTQAIHVVAGFHDVAFLQQIRQRNIKVVVCTYSLFQKRSAVAQSLLEHAFHVVICDESHNLKEPRSQRCEFILPLLNKSKRLLLLSGTPALARPVELWTQLHALNQNLFGTYSIFTRKYCNPQKKRIGRGRFIWDYGGSSNEAELHAKLRQVMVRRLKANVLNELPPKVRTVVPVVVPANHKAACQAAMKELQACSPTRDAFSIQRALDQQQQQQQTGTGGNFCAAVMQAYQTTGVGKAQAVVDYVLDFLSGSSNQKILVFGHHQAVLNHIDAALMRHAPNSHMRIDGAVPAAVRTQLVRQFQTNARIRVGLLSMTAAGVGLTLTAASTVLFSELHWTPGTLAQAEDRAHRIGTTANSIQIIYMICRDATVSLDPMLWRMLSRKIGTLGQIVDGKTETPYLHTVPEQALPENSRRSVQDEVSDFFATGHGINGINSKKRKTPVKGSIQSFFQPAVSKKSTPPSLSTEKAPPPIVRTNSAHQTPAKVEPPKSLSNWQAKTEDPLTNTTSTSKQTPRAKSVEWECASCTFLNKKPVNAQDYYYPCQICQSLYIPVDPPTPHLANSTPARAAQSALNNDNSKKNGSLCASMGSRAQTLPVARIENRMETIVVDGDNGPTPNGMHRPSPSKIVEIDSENPKHGASMQAGSGRKELEAKNRHYLEFCVSANSGRISIFYAATKENAMVNFDINDVVTQETSDKLLQIETKRCSQQRLEASHICFDDNNVRAVTSKLRDFHLPGMKRRYGKDLRNFVSSYIALGAVDQKAVRDAKGCFPPGNLGRALLHQSLASPENCFDRYTGGAKERARQNRKQGVCSQQDSAVLNGSACAWCGTELSRAQKKANATYCTQKCAEEGRLKRGGRYASVNIRSAMFALEGGKCSICKLAVHDLFEQIKVLQPAERLNKLLQVGWKLPASGRAMANFLQDPKEGDFWQVDHIRAVAEGGGGCGLENFRTLCTPCHQEETEKLRVRLRLASPSTTTSLGGGGQQGVASNGKKRKQLDIRQTLFTAKRK